MKLKIRKSQPDDAPVLADLWHEMATFHAKHGPYWRIKPNCKKGYIAYMHEVGKSKDKAVFVAEDNGKPVGFVLAQLSKRARIFVQNEHGLIVDLAVTKNYRRGGIGEKLFRHAIRWFKAKGVKTVEVRVSTANTVATDFWRNMGFEPYMTMNKKDI
jgi:ribosomal protein S18 acetylase RimI-like enzyme